MTREPSVSLPSTTSTPSQKNLLLRIASAAVLAPVAIGTAYLGDWAFTIFWTLAAIAVWWEWLGLVRPSASRVVLATGACALALQGIVLEVGKFSFAVMIIALGILAAIVTAARHGPMIAGGLLYSSALLISPVLLRADIAHGLTAIVFLFALVWGTDIGGYFFGRAIRGPKLAPAISPKKTWSGAIGGLLVGAAASIAVLQIFSIRVTVAVIFLMLALSIVSQAGDLFESALKRRFNAKDASGLIPGHGGVMDRLDGFIFASAVAALVGVLRGGFDNAAAGLLVW
jgi:phosphatidate cytidylyltransferase